MPVAPMWAKYGCNMAALPSPLQVRAREAAHRLGLVDREHTEMEAREGLFVMQELHTSTRAGRWLGQDRLQHLLACTEVRARRGPGRDLYGLLQLAHSTCCWCA